MRNIIDILAKFYQSFDIVVVLESVLKKMRKQKNKYYLREVTQNDIEINQNYGNMFTGNMWNK